mmetsp:Transcript_31918/g.85200  ORF Transcript_31918/g.85200 Transcript_31918/m.85200 type:complete len:211 (+) Transcript_31918:1522-2154(+)
MKAWDISPRFTTGAYCVLLCGWNLVEMFVIALGKTVNICSPFLPNRLRCWIIPVWAQIIELCRASSPTWKISPLPSHPVHWDLVTSNICWERLPHLQPWLLHRRRILLRLPTRLRYPLPSTRQLRLPSIRRRSFQTARAQFGNFLLALHRRTFLVRMLTRRLIKASPPAKTPRGERKRQPGRAGVSLLLWSAHGRSLSRWRQRQLRLAGS